MEVPQDKSATGTECTGDDGGPHRDVGYPDEDASSGVHDVEPTGGDVHWERPDIGGREVDADTGGLRLGPRQLDLSFADVDGEHPSPEDGEREALLARRAHEVQDPCCIELAQGVDDALVERATSGREELGGVKPVRPTMCADVGDLLPRQAVLLRERRPRSGIARPRRPL